MADLFSVEDSLSARVASSLVDRVLPGAGGGGVHDREVRSLGQAGAAHAVAEETRRRRLAACPEGGADGGDRDARFGHRELVGGARGGDRREWKDGDRADDRRSAPGFSRAVRSARPIVTQLGDLTDEPVPAPRAGDDVAPVPRGISEHFPEREDVLREVGLFDDHVGPDESKQLVLLDKLSTALYQCEQHLEGLAGHRHRLLIAQQALCPAIDVERPELISVKHNYRRHRDSTTHARLSG